MRDIQAFVRAQVGSLLLAPDREQKIVEVWAARVDPVDVLADS